MKRTSVLIAVAIFAGAMLASTAAVAQGSRPRSPPGGFDRPLSETPRFGSPGASPTLTSAEFKALLAHWADYDANKNQRFDKTEAPELFAKLFDQADVNHDGALDEKERARVSAPAATPPPSPAPKRAQPSGPVIDPVSRLLFGDPVFGGPPIPGAAK